MKRVSSNLLHLSIYQCVIWGITNRFCPHYQIKRGEDGYIKEKEPCTSIVQTSKTLKIHYEKHYDF